MPSTGFKPSILGLQTYALDCTATKQSCVIVLLGKNSDLEADINGGRQHSACKTLNGDSYKKKLILNFDKTTCFFYVRENDFSSSFPPCVRLRLKCDGTRA
jgi:hypothetical protein